MKFAYKLFHLPKDHSRNKLVETAHSSLLSQAKYFDAPTIKISSIKEYLDFYKENPDFNVDPLGYNLDNIQGWKFGEVGIWASNWKAWKLFIESDYDYLILLEDDIKIYDSFMELLSKYISELPEDWDAFHFFSPADQHYKYSSTMDVSENTCHAYQDWSCACYIVSKKGAQRMIDLSSRGIRLPLDWFMFRQQNLLKVYTVKPGAASGCITVEVESTFQEEQKREVLNGIL
jgi:GR25 family glycosyltransferase involved in LPS biosynthesis